MEKGEPSYTVDGNVNSCNHYWEVWRFLKKLKIDLPYSLPIPLLGIYPEKTQFKKYMHLSVYSSTIYNSQIMEAT